MDCQHCSPGRTDGQVQRCQWLCMSVALIGQEGVGGGGEGEGGWGGGGGGEGRGGGGVIL